jgi:putative membrane protein
MKRIGLGLAVAGLAACLSTGVGGSAIAQGTTSDDKTFMKDSGQDSLAEINYAKLALEKSQDPNVRKFATRMIEDHEKLIQSMKPLMAKYGVKPYSGPAIVDHVKYDELKMKSGISFDRAYVEAMVKDHNTDLKKFIDEENKTTNADVKAAVAKGEGVIKEHTKMIDDIAHMGGIETPPLPAGA